MDKNLKKLILKKGGNLFLCYDTWDGEILTPGEEEVLNEVPSFWLHELDFEFESGVVFEDILLYVKKNLDYWDKMIGCHLKDLVLQAPREPNFCEDEQIQKLVLSWTMTGDKMAGKKVVGNPRLDFGGIGISEGETTNFGVSTCTVSELANLPVEIKDNLTIYFDNFDRHFLDRKMKTDEDFKDFLNRETFLRKYCPTFFYWLFRFEHWFANSKKDYGQMRTSLFQVIYGIFYELSFYGGPEEKIEFGEELRSRIAEYDAQVSLDVVV